MRMCVCKIDRIIKGRIFIELGKQTGHYINSSGGKTM